MREIIALSPHCMNALKKEYGDLGIKVSHYSEVVARLIGEGALKIEGKCEHKVAYHEPCFLGKRNGVFDEPRNVLGAPSGDWSCWSSAVRGRRRFVARVGAAGCSSRWRRRRDCGTRRSALPMRREMGAEIIATSCPFCLMTLEDAAKEKGQTVKELSEILWRSYK